MPGFQFDLRSDGGGLRMVALNDGVLVPEPATLVLLMFAAAGWSLRRHRDA
jgi:PEP-CTERM motif